MPDRPDKPGLIEKAGLVLLPRRLMERLDVDERRRRVFVFVGIALSAPLFAFFTAYHLFVLGKTTEVIPDFIMLMFILGSIPVLRLVVDSRPVYRVDMAVLLATLVLNIAKGGYDGADVLWLFAFPLVSFFLFGRIEGFAWVLALLAPSAVFLLVPRPFGAHVYSPDFFIRFFPSFAVVTMLAYMFESLRHRYYTMLEKKQEDLEEALRNVKTLRGLLPICGGCKKIRDDAGYWQAVDVYLQNHTDARFTHGLCDNCLKEQYPEIYDKLLREGKIKADGQG